MTKKRDIVTISLSPGMRVKLEKFAKDDRRTLSNYLAVVIEKHVSDRTVESKHQEQAA